MTDARRDAILQTLGIDRYVPRADRVLGAARAEASRAAVTTGATPAAVPTAPVVDGAGDAGAVEAMDWETLARTVATCTRCGLEATRTQTVFGVGNRQAEWFVVGEAPGEQEDKRGEPFVGRAGQLLDSMLRALGLSRETVYIANVLKSRPPGNRDPKPHEVEACLPYLQRQIALVQPKLILCVGRIAAQNLLGTDAALAKLRSRVHTLAPFGIPVVVTYHPAYLLRSPAEKRKAWTDLLYAREVLRGHRA